MGTWNAGLFSNDTTSDIKETYIDFLKRQFTDEEAYQKTVDEYSELLGTDEEPLFWYALADTQWNVGRLMPSVKNTALKFIEEKGGLDFYDVSSKGRSKWETTLQKLKDKLETPLPPTKRFRKTVEFIRNPWNIGDVYAYQFHTEKARETGFYGKYILFQKVADVEYYKDIIFSVIQVFDQVFENLPTVEAINGIRVLPLALPPEGNKSIDEYVPSFTYYLKAIMEYHKKVHYPKNHLTFIGNMPVEVVNCSSRSFRSFYLEKNSMDECLIMYHTAWHGVGY